MNKILKYLQKEYYKFWAVTMKHTNMQKSTLMHSTQRYGEDLNKHTL
jgi:hypothetical protein